MYLLDFVSSWLELRNLDSSNAMKYVVSILSLYKLFYIIISLKKIIMLFQKNQIYFTFQKVVSFPIVENARTKT